MSKMPDPLNAFCAHSTARLKGAPDGPLKGLTFAAKDLFDIVEQKFGRYRSDSTKSAEDLILIIMIVNHLREWIAPGFKKTYDKDRKTWTWPTRVAIC